MSQAFDHVIQDDGTNFVFTDNSIPASAMISIAPCSALTFGNGATITWKNGKLEFDGPMEESAKLFFETFLKQYADDYIKSIMPHDNLKYLEWCANEREKHE